MCQVDRFETLLKPTSEDLCFLFIFGTDANDFKKLFCLDLIGQQVSPLTDILKASSTIFEIRLEHVDFVVLAISLTVISEAILPETETLIFISVVSFSKLVEFIETIADTSNGRNA